LPKMQGKIDQRLPGAKKKTRGRGRKTGEKISKVGDNFTKTLPKKGPPIREKK